MIIVSVIKVPVTRVMDGFENNKFIQDKKKLPQKSFNSFQKREKDLISIRGYINQC